MKPSGENAYTVSQVNARVERLLGDDPVLADVAVEGEVSNCKYNQSGHIYFTLKDSLSALSCVMFAGKRRSGLRFAMKDGDKVVVRGYVGVYATAGRYQLYAESIELSGVGSLYQRFEELKRKLAAEGLFAPEHKHPLPSYAMRIGIVTAPTGDGGARYHPCVAPAQPIRSVDTISRCGAGRCGSSFCGAGHQHARHHGTRHHHRRSRRRLD